MLIMLIKWQNEDFEYEYQSKKIDGSWLRKGCHNFKEEKATAGILQRIRFETF